MTQVDSVPPSSMPPSRQRYALWDPRRATGRLLVAVLLGVVATLAAPRTVAWSVRAVLGWDVGAFVLTAFAWWIIARADPKQTAERAGAEDPGGHMVFVIAAGASLFSLFAATFVLRHVKAMGEGGMAIWTAFALIAVVLSWVLTHTAFTLRYAHLYYRHHHAGGIEFPGGHHPADMDFAYFSFTLGMCFQTSDVVVTSSRIRRTVLVHALISFVYNTTILALALNLVFGLFG